MSRYVTKSNLDKAVAKFKRELPGWWWKVIEGSHSCEADCGPGCPDRGLGVTNVPKGTVRTRYFELALTAEIQQPSTCADALLAVLETAKEARRRFFAGERLPNPKIHVNTQALARLMAMKICEAGGLTLASDPLAMTDREAKRADALNRGHRGRRVSLAAPRRKRKGSP